MFTLRRAPADPDAAWLLVGLSHDPDGAVAYIENTKSGEVVRLAGPSAFSQGEVTALGYDTLVYKVEDQQRMIRVGQSFVGTEVQPAASTGSSSESGKTSSGAGSLQDRLRALRERRAQELGKEKEPAAGEDTKPEAEATDTPGDAQDADTNDTNNGQATSAVQPTREQE